MSELDDQQAEVRVRFAAWMAERRAAQILQLNAAARAAQRLQARIAALDIAARRYDEAAGDDFLAIAEEYETWLMRPVPSDTPEED